MDQLTPEDLRIIQFFSKLQNENLPERLKRYHNLLDTLVYLNEVMAEQGIEIKSWQKLSETLLMKFIFHGFTLH